ncbi:YrhB domain-containing protein [Streptomyces sp. NPDC054844]
MIDREFAVRAAQEDLDRRYSGQLVVSGTEEHELVWIVYYQSAEYLRTGDLSHMLGGNGPYLVDLVDGGLHQIGPVSYVTGAWEVDYRSRIRKMVTRTAVDELHDEIRQTAVAQGRILAMHLLRQRVPELPHGEVIEYVTALQTGPAPPRLVDAATRALVPTLDPVLAVRTLRSGQSTER